MSELVAFVGDTQVAGGSPPEVARMMRLLTKTGADKPMLVFDATSGRQVDLDVRETDAQLLERFAGSSVVPARGRPKLGVIPREVTLLPRHWDWLAEQPGGASATLRRLVEEARRTHRERDAARLAGEAVDRFMSAMTGNLAGHEEASRAFWRKERERFMQVTDAWPADVREHVRRLATRAWQAAQAG